MTRSTGWDWTRPQLRALGHCVYHIHTVAEIQLVDGKNPNRLPCWRISQPSTVGNSGISKYINPYSGDHPELTAFFWLHRYDMANTTRLGVACCEICGIKELHYQTITIQQSVYPYPITSIISGDIATAIYRCWYFHITKRLVAAWWLSPTPLKNMTTRQLGWWNSQDMEK